MKELFPVLLGALFCSVFVWFALCMWLFKLLENRHPGKYNAMGRPSLILNNSLSNNISFMKFLLRREYAELDDKTISRLGGLMLVFLVLYMCAFLALLLSMPFGYAS